MGKAILFGGGGSGVHVDEMTSPATASDVYSGDTFATKDNEELVTGNVADKTTSHTQTLNETWTIPAGYHDGTGKVKQNLTYVGKQTSTINANGSVNITPGYHNGTGTVTANNSHYAGGTVIPGTSDTVLKTSGKVLDAKLYIPKQANLVANNIVRGKSIFGVAGGFDTLATMKRDQQVYNGSSFFGWMNGGVIINNRGWGDAWGSASYWNGYSDHKEVDITSGSLFVERNGHIGYDEEYSARLISAKSIDFSQFSRIRLTGNLAVSMKAYGDRYATAHYTVYQYAVFRFYEWTNVSGTRKMVARSDIESSPTLESSDWKNTYTGSVNFDESFDISSWSEKNGFLGLRVWDGHDSHEGEYYHTKITITGIWLYV
jgi:hypothetical protein